MAQLAREADNRFERDRQPLQKGDLKGALAGGEHAIVEIITATHSGMTTGEFGSIVDDWFASARHPKTQQPHTTMVYQPMLELLAFLRANGFKTFIVTGGGIEFVRTFAEETYGVPPEQVVGSAGKLAFQFRGGVPVLEKLPAVDFVDDGEGKPVGIQMHIGRRPIAAFGNPTATCRCCNGHARVPARISASTCTTPTPSANGAYHRQSDIGRLDKGLTAAADGGWTVVDMKEDWATIFAGAK